MSDRSEDGAIVPFGVFHSFDIRSASGSSTGAALVVADFVNDEQKIHLSIRENVSDRICLGRAKRNLQSHM